MISTTSSTSFVHPSLPPTRSRTNKPPPSQAEEIQKLKKDLEKSQTQYERSLILHEKQLAAQEERVNKISLERDMVVKEKNTLGAEMTKKDKELSDLSHKHGILKANCSRLRYDETVLYAMLWVIADGKSSPFEKAQEKLSKVHALQRKVDELEKQNMQIQSKLDTRSVKEREQLTAQITILKHQIETLTAEKLALQTAKQQVESQLRQAEPRVRKIEDELRDKVEELEGKEREWAAQSQSLQKSRNDMERQLAIERDESATALEKLREAYDAIRMDMDESATSYATQREAYLARIAELEAGLESARSETAQWARKLEKVEAELMKRQRDNQGMVEEYDALVKKLEGDVKREKDARDRLNREAGEHERQLRLQLDDTRREWERERRDLAATIESLKSSLADLETSYAQLEDRLHSQVSERDAALSTTNHEVTSLRGTVHSLESSLTNQTTYIDQLETQLDTSQQSITRLEATIKDLQASLHHATITHSTEIEASRKEMEDAARIFQQKQEEFKAAIRALGKEKADIEREAMHLRDDLEAERNRREDEVAALKRERGNVVSRLEARVGELMKSLEENEARARVVEGQLDRLKKEYSSASAEWKSRLEQSKTELQSTIDHHETDRRDLQSQIRELEMTLSTREGELTSVRAEHAAHVQSSSGAMEELKGMVRRWTEKHEEARRECLERVKEVEGLKGAAAVREKEFDRAIKGYETKIEETERGFEGREREVRGVVEGLEGEVEVLRGQCDGLRKEVERLRRVERFLGGKVEGLGEEVSRWEGECEKAREDGRRVESELEGLKEVLTIREKELGDLGREALHLETRLDKRSALKLISNGGSAVLHGTLAWWEALAGVPITTTRLTAQGIVGATGYSYVVAKGLIGGGVNIASSAGQFAIGTGLAFADTTGSAVNRARQDPVGTARGIVPAPIFGKVEGAVQSIKSTKVFRIKSSESEETVRGTLSALVESEKYVWAKSYKDYDRSMGALWDAADTVLGGVPSASITKTGTAAAVRSNSAADLGEKVKQKLDAAEERREAIPEEKKHRGF
ncbi:hypothetical protein HDV00_002754 [Rhizophlyctis rosea]|nr:hypothetical protein HDV00_002754 [Rhizophlyctis rosea]